jgi:cell division septum initiation protein DivIVA
MEAASGSLGRAFRRRLFGYGRAEVDTYMARAAEAHTGVLVEVERLKAAEPLTRVGGDVAALLTTFAETVAARREDAVADLDRARQEAEAYAEEKRAEADRLVGEAREEAGSLADELLSQARHAVAVTAEQWVTVSRALETAAGGIKIAVEALRELAELPASHVVDLTESGGLLTNPEPSAIPDPSARI